MTKNHGRYRKPDPHHRRLSAPRHNGSKEARRAITDRMANPGVLGYGLHSQLREKPPRNAKKLIRKRLQDLGLSRDQAIFAAHALRAYYVEQYKRRNRIYPYIP